MGDRQVGEGMVWSTGGERNREEEEKEDYERIKGYEEEKRSEGPGDALCTQSKGFSASVTFCGPKAGA